MTDNGFHTVRGYQLLKQNKKLLTSGMEDYLEMIYRKLSIEGYIRINSLSEFLNVKPSSATKMVQKLFEMGYLKYEKYGIIFLTDKGRDMGQYLLERHNIVEAFLSNMGIYENLLIETELIEHNVSHITLECMKRFNAFIEKFPEVAINLKNFH